MAKTLGKNGNNILSLNEVLNTHSLNPLRTGMPSLDSIVEVPLGSASMADAVGASKYVVIETNEVDDYDIDQTKAPMLALSEAAAAVPTGDNFTGKDRKAAKISKAKGKLEKFNDLKDLLESLTPDAEMVALGIPTGQKSDRVEQEERNVQVKAFIYAASREKDNDFHLIVGRAPNKKEMYMNMELSGLPPKSSPIFAALKAARDAYKKFYKETLKHNLPGLKYQYYPNPPLSVVIEGSLFFDATHSHGNRPGPPSLKSRIASIWEIHPITKIVFKP
ncbi:MAG: hypothetical protein QOH63_4178 [Acidobacteriota bacterium]|jgi:hypothetical protein|nr:hypothetical protein [Acidobacteriota bacterium]